MRILLVDPSRGTRRGMAAMLGSRGHEVFHAADRTAAMEKLRHDTALDLLITSLDLPEAAGLELCWVARTLTDTNRVLHVIAMTSGPGLDRLEEALDSGADEVLRKPVQKLELFARLRAVERLRHAQRELIRRAELDALTELPNRRTFFERAQPLCAQASSRCVSLVMLDVDRFKSVNDTYGHDVGDAVLRGVARVVEQRPGLAARLGGEEFALLLPGLPLDAAELVAEKLRAALAATPVPTPAGALSITASLGVATLEEDGAPDTLMKRADQALYTAKREGRNRVVLAPMPEPSAQKAEVILLHANSNAGPAPGVAAPLTPDNFAAFSGD
ncbi:diguanylate cyclase [Roseomonas sp. GC11]|uniref:GGDEF domain-containing protein n=1 Tax=Roseomonas sp. GC11 TaxID=2950546 RepID=UPI00210B7218|nr:diguanylate cyclase [Roseomonas sp. GC11]MCQ4160912.1 diguanylate cyclase [Roseomonas sp. GC11]